MTLRLFLLVTATLLMSVGTTTFAQEGTPQIKTQSLGNDIYLLTGPGGNIGVSVGEDGVLVIDDKFARFADQIITQISAITEEPIKFVINTHYHGDHTGANAELKQVGATIVAHDNVRKRMGLTFDNNLWGRPVKAVAEAKWPTLTFSDTTTFHFNDDMIQVIHTPSAHTDGDSIIHFSQNNLIHMGDNFFNGMFPYVDVDSGGTLQGMIASHDQALALANDETQIIPGHGPMANKTDLQNTRDMLADILQRVKIQKANGQTEDEIIESGLLADLSDYSGFIDEKNMIRIAYRSVKIKT